MAKLRHSEIINLSDKSFDKHIDTMDRPELIHLVCFMYGYITQSKKNV